MIPGADKRPPREGIGSFQQVQEARHPRGLPQGQDSRRFLSFRYSFQLERKLLPLGADQADGERDRKGKLFGLARSWLTGLGDGQFVGMQIRVAVPLNLEMGCSCWVIPVLELGEIDATGVLHSMDEVVSGNGTTIETLEIEIHPFAIELGT